MAANCACGPISPFRCRATISPRQQAGQPRGLLLSRPGLPSARSTGPANSCRRASSRSAARTRPRPTPRCSRSASSRPPHYGADRARHPHGRRRPVLRAGRSARSRAGLEAAADQGFQPQAGRSRTISIAWRSVPPRNDAPEYQGVLAALAGSDPQGRARAGHRPAFDRRHQRRRRPLGRRDRRPLSGAGRARRADLAAAARRAR